MSPVPDAEVLEDLVYAARFGDLDDVKAFVESQEGSQWTREQRIDFLCSATDEFRNTALHMSCANGHQEIVSYLVSLQTPRLLQNESGNTALHWAAQNGQIEVLKILAPCLTPDQVLQPNLGGFDAIALAEERASNERCLECAGYLSGLLPETEEEKQQQQQQQQADEAETEEDAAAAPPVKGEHVEPKEDQQGHVEEQLRKVSVQ